MSKLQGRRIASCKLALVFLLCPVRFVCTASQLLTSPENGADFGIKQIVDGLVAPFLAQHQAPGAIVAASVKGRHSFFTYGSATDDGTAFTPTTLVEIGSCTKVFTTTLFALAIARHQIDPDASAGNYLLAGFRLQPGARAVTPRELALFTSGMPDDPPDLPRRLEMSSIDHYTTKDFLRWVSHWTPDSPPPAPYKYSNAGMGLLGYLVAEPAKKPWEEQLQREILDPLGMVDTAVRPNSEQMTRMAQGHRRNGTLAPAWPVYAWFAAGALRSTAADMVQFGEANLFHSSIQGKAVSPELVAAMQLAQTPVISCRMGTPSKVWPG